MGERVCMKRFLPNIYAMALFTFGAASFLQADNLSTRDIFNPLFPATPFKNAVASCMKVRSVVEMVRNHTGPTQDQQLLLDSAMGRIGFLFFDVDAMLNDATSYTLNDVEYLLNVIDYMIAEINHTIEKKNAQEQHNAIRHLVNLIKNKLENVLISA